MSTDAQQRWPTQADVDAFYGNPRGKSIDFPSGRFELENIIRIVPPYQMYYAGAPITAIRAHKLCAAALLEALNAIKKAAGGDEKVLSASGANIYGGAYNYRLKRGGNTLSMHSWGCAIDLDPARNAFHDTTPNFTLYPFVIRAFEEVGATWGGRWTGQSCDGMHFQFARV